MPRVLGKLSIDDIYKITGGSGMNLHNDLLVIGPTGYNNTSDTATINFGDVNSLIRATYDDSLDIGSTQIIFTSSGSEAMRLVSDGSLGIGVTSPIEQLHVEGNIRLSGALHKNGNVLTLPDITDTLVGTTTIDTLNNKTLASPFFTGNLSLENGTYISTDEIRARDVDGLKLYDAVGNGIFVENGGNVGIGITDPSSKLHVSGNMILGDGNTGEQDINFLSANGNWQLGTNDNGNGTDSNQFYLYNTTDETYSFTVQKGSGNMGIGLLTPVHKLHVNGTALLDAGNTEFVVNTTSIKMEFTGSNLFFEKKGLNSTSVYNTTGGYLSLGTGSTDEILYINPNGNVGIGDGVTGPIHKLDVDGDGRISGNLRTSVTSITSTTTLDHTHSVVVCDASSGGFTVTLPVSHDGTSEPNFKGSVFHIIKIDSSVNVVTVSVSGSDVLDGTASNITLTGQDDRVTVMNAGGVSSVGRWYTI